MAPKRRRRPLPCPASSRRPLPCRKMPAGEDRLLRWLRDQLDEPLIGDDAAVLPAGGPFAVTVDHQIAGVHFPLGLGEAVIARRLLAVNLSDLAATGAAPAYAFLALAAP